MIPGRCCRCGAEHALERGKRGRTIGLITSRIEVLYLCGRCWTRGRALSPYEDLTGERFWDHLTPLDRELDRLILKHNLAKIVDTYLPRPRRRI